jgi:uncharacterized repeat protein (TIGR01451 family)
MGKVYAQDPPPSGQEITNQASLTYEETNGVERIQFTNEVKVIVDGNPDFRFFPNNSIVDFRGTQVEITHFLTNDGNAPSTFRIIGYNSVEDEYDLADLSWNTQDVTRAKLSTVANRDTLVTEVTLAAGEQFEVSYFGTIQASEPRDTLKAVMVFEATDLNTGVTKTNFDEIQIQIGDIVEIEKSQTNADDLFPGDSFLYTISGENVGDLTALPLEILIDGITEEKVILMDSLPANLSFEQFESVSKGTPLYHEVGASKYEFVTTKPENADDIDIIGVAFDSLRVGETFSVDFTVQVNEGASGTIVNVAEISYVDPEGEVTTAAASNDVVTDLGEPTAEIDYFVDEEFEEKTATSSIGEPLHIQATASACNEDRTAIEIVEILISSELTGDLEEFTGVETGRNTGIFQIEQEVPTRDGFEFPTVQFNEILETAEEDIITAELECNGIRGGSGTPFGVIDAAVIVDPFGIVFDSETNAEIQGAEVRIIDVFGTTNGGDAGGLATVYRPNGRDITNNIENSDVQGKYRFPFLRPGTYRLEVIPPAGYEFSSAVPIDSLPDNRKVDSLASFGVDFVISDAPIGLDFDIPLDPLANGVLFAEKTVDRKVADIGDFVNYKIEITSQAINTVRNLQVFDNLPFGFEFVEGTARVDGDTLANPDGGVGPNLRFLIGDIEPGGKKILTYRVYIGPGADRGDGINTALVQSDELIIKTSNEAKVEIEVRGGVFSDEALIVGKVFLDCDENNMQDASEVGIPGVRIYLENGNYVVTDSEGKYCFYAVKPNKHVIKIDNYSLPEGSRLKVLDNRHAFDPSSRFADVKKGELHRADFAVCECTGEVYEEIEHRAALLTSDNDVISNSLKQSFSVNESSNRGAGRFDKASGTIGNVNAPDFNTDQAGSENTQNIATSPDATELANNELPLAINIEEFLQNAEPGTEILNVINGDTLSSDKVTILAKGTNGALFDLYVNGDLIPANRIGQRSSSIQNGLQIWEYVSIDLQPGENEIILQEGDPFGNVRGSDTKTVFVPGELYEIELNIVRNNVAADGSSTALVEALFLDENGILIGSRLPVTLDTEFGVWLAADNNAQSPGSQIFVEGGKAELELHHQYSRFLQEFEFLLVLYLMKLRSSFCRIYVH